MAAATSFERGLALAESSRFVLRFPYLLTQLAEVKQALGRPAEATAAAAGSAASRPHPVAVGGGAPRRAAGATPARAEAAGERAARR